MCEREDDPRDWNRGASSPQCWAATHNAGQHIRGVIMAGLHDAVELTAAEGIRNMIVLHSVAAHARTRPAVATAVTIDKGADSKQKELYGWKASSRNLKHLEQH
jgi:hypothetical protein